jgi:hypothetical protein
VSEWRQVTGLNYWPSTLLQSRWCECVNGDRLIAQSYCKKSKGRSQMIKYSLLLRVHCFGLVTKVAGLDYSEDDLYVYPYIVHGHASPMLNRFQIFQRVQRRRVSAAGVLALCARMIWAHVYDGSSCN